MVNAFLLSVLSVLSVANFFPFFEWSIDSRPLPLDPEWSRQFTNSIDVTHDDRRD